MKEFNSNYNKKPAYLLGMLAFVVVIVLLVVWRTEISDFVKDERDETGLTVLSDTYVIDQIYKSMKGPESTQELYASKNGEPELIWVTGFRAVMVESDGTTPMSQEFMCHSNLDIDVGTHTRLMGWKKNNPSPRLFTLSQGQYEIKFPEGFGIPMFSNEKLSLTTQVLNLNDPVNRYEVRHKVTIDYVRDSDLKAPTKPLLPVSAYGLKLLEGRDGYFNVRNAGDKHGEGCLVGENAATDVYIDAFQRNFTGHWVVKPGREVNYTLVTKMLNIPYDTKIHYIAVHLHPFAESMELKDLTTGETVFKSKVKGANNRIGIDDVEYFSSPVGIPIYKDHEYQVISVYNNTSDEEQDSMAVMFLYLLDKEFNNSVPAAQTK